MSRNREITFTTPKPAGNRMLAVSGELSYVYIEASVHRPHFNGGGLSFDVPLDYLSPEDKKLAEDYVAMMLRQADTGEAASKKKAAEEAARAAAEATLPKSPVQPPTPEVIP